MCFQQRQDHGPLAATLTGYNDSGTTPRRRLASDIHWADLGDADGSRPAKRRPVLVMQSASFNASRLATVMVAAISSNTALAAMPGNVFLPAAVTGLQRDSVVNVTAVVTLDKDDLGRTVGSVPHGLMLDIDQGLRQALAL